MQNVYSSDQMQSSSIPKFSKESKIKANKTDIEMHCAPNLVHSSKSLTKSADRFSPQSEAAIDSYNVLTALENQIIPNEKLSSRKVDGTVLPQPPSGTVQHTKHGSNNPASFSQLQTGSASISDIQRSHTMSVCSNSSAEESLDGLSRSSFCDGCSCSNVPSCSINNTPSTVSCDQTSEERSSICSLQSQVEENLSQWAEELLETSMYGLKTENTMPVTHRNHDEDIDCNQHQKKNCLKKLSLSNEQLIFIILRLILSKYKTLMINMEQGQKDSHSQRLTIACLIQAVVVLARRCRSSSQQWHKIQTDLKLLQIRHESLKKSQRKIYVVVCLLILFNVLNLSPVKRRLLSCFRFFGIVETIKKINRTRKMIADNWRNIPLLLTDFWRIFIFRSNIRRNL
ncbi:hypothetical protein ACF0H5_008999 [Mactra antiquata]